MLGILLLLLQISFSFPDCFQGGSLPEQVCNVLSGCVYDFENMICSISSQNALIFCEVQGDLVCDEAKRLCKFYNKSQSRCKIQTACDWSNSTCVAKNILSAVPSTFSPTTVPTPRPTSIQTTIAPSQTNARCCSMAKSICSKLGKVKVRRKRIKLAYRICKVKNIQGLCALDCS